MYTGMRKNTLGVIKKGRKCKIENNEGVNMTVNKMFLIYEEIK